MATAVSVLVVNFNYERYVAQTIRSIIEQTHKDITLILCDDGSTDESWRRICELCSDTAARFTRIQISRSSSNRGKNAWINWVIPSIFDEYVTILDSDDTIPPDYLSILLAELNSEASGGADFAYTDCNLIDSAGTTIGFGRSTSFDAKLVEKHSYIPEPALIRTRILADALPLDSSIRRGSKHDKYKRLINNGAKGFHSLATRFNYRMHRGNISGIGERVLAELAEQPNYRERILSGYWSSSPETMA